MEYESLVTELSEQSACAPSIQSVRVTGQGAQNPYGNKLMAGGDAYVSGGCMYGHTRHCVAHDQPETHRHRRGEESEAPRTQMARLMVLFSTVRRLVR